MVACYFASSLIYGNVCIYVAELKKLGRLSALVEILSFGKLGAHFAISWMTNMIAHRTIVLFSQTPEIAVHI